MSVQNRVLGASAIGTFIEWYDFFLFGTAAALVFNKLFFPQFDPRTGTLLVLLTYATGFVARPLGGYVAGHFGDRIGRRKTLMGTLILMGLATFLMGLAPPYEMAGIWGAVMLVVLRLVQGFAAGGEWSGAIVLVAESVPERRGLWGGVLTAVNQASFIVGAFILTLVNWLLDDAQFLSWGWRIPFLLSIVIVAVGIYIRLRVPESPEFERVERGGMTSSKPLLEVISSPRNVLAIMALRIGENTYYFAVSVFAIAYGVSFLQVPRSVTLTAITVGSALAVVGSIIGGALADKLGSRALLSWGFVFQLLWIVPFFLLYDTRDPTWIMLATVVAIVAVNSTIDAPQAKFMTPLFPARVRYSGIAAGRETAAIIGGLTPVVAGALIALTGSPWLFAAFLAGCTILGFAGVMLARPTEGPSVQSAPSGVSWNDGVQVAKSN